MSRTIDVAYGTGWDAGSVLGPIGPEEAAARDAAGQPYAVVLRQTGSAEAVVAQVARARNYLGIAVYDARGRRFLEVDLRQLDADRLFLRRRSAWAYPDDLAPEFAPDAGRVTVSLWPDGRGSEVVEPQGDKGGARHTTAKVPEEQRWFEVPGFGCWERLFAPLGIEGADRVELREITDVPRGGTVEPDWRAPEGMRPRHLAELFVPGTRFSSPDGEYTVREPIEAGTLLLPSGRLVAKDPTYGAGDEAAGFTATVAPGSYRVQIARAAARFEEYVAARVLVSGRPAVRWEAALLDGQDERLLGEGEFYGFGVDAGTAAFTDATADPDLGRRYWDGLVAGTQEEDVHGVAVVDDPANGTNLVAYPSGRGDGTYPVWVGRDREGEVTCFVADMLILHRAEPSTAEAVT
ncbi:DUF4241 domain-containing protein [Streptomyces sp. NPDC087859]|uniref:DUF4241 domain-containing protein n=1 Tax=Streptomyces sp. NPDC087859 TaxID=3365812 RepID=UPI0037F3C8DF